MDANELACDVASATWHDWNHIPWSEANRVVGRLQTRIAKAANTGNWRSVKRLQRLLVHSTSGKALAVRRVTENQGRKTPGVDGETWSTPKEKWLGMLSLNTNVYHPLPLRRVHIPKSNGKMRPLGIPTMRDRAMQALFLLGLEPVAETTADLHSYGFRPYRSTVDAIIQCRNVLDRAHSPAWILEGDIQGCFDNISHDWMLQHIPMDKAVLRKWLKAGYVEKKRLFPTEAGTPQGGIISPVLANMVLDGLGRLLDETFKRPDKVHLVRYADDFIVTGSSKELLEQRVKPLIECFLLVRGLSLAPEKTKITHVSEGFDFLGWYARKPRKKFLTVPSKKNKKAFYAKVRDVIQEMRAAKQADVIEKLNPILRGWANYHRSQMASKHFSRMDHRIWGALWRWATRRHPNKGKRWIKRRYFRCVSRRNWVFACDTKVLTRLASFKIVRHVKIRADANPYDPALADYFDERRTRLLRQTLAGRRKLLWLWTEQKGRCPICDQSITKETKWVIHHRVFRCMGGTDKLSNLQLLHQTCHRQLHAVAGHR